MQCAHWWNPFAYLAARLLHQSCETACDLAVTGRMDSAGRTAYMKAVLAFAAAGVKAPPLTTSMSAGGREIERRFIMIARQKPVKLLARLTALALTACLLVSGLGVGALALNASEGKLENNQQEILYPHSELHFSVELEPDKTYPDWLNNIVGADQKVDVNITLVSARQTGGLYEGLNDFITITGSRGTRTLLNSAMYFGSLEDVPGAQLAIRFNYSAPYARYLEDNTGDQNELVQIRLHYTNSYSQPPVEVSFSVESDYQLSILSMNSGPMQSSYSILTTTDISSTSGIFIAQNFLDPVTRMQYLHSPYIFGIHEINYRNQNVDGISIQLQSASASEIRFETDITRREPRYCFLEVYDSKWDYAPLDQNAVSLTTPSHTTIPVTFLSDHISLKPLKEFVSGETYRVEIALLDAAGSVIYRQLEHVTIP